MATDQQLVQVLVATTEKLLRRTLTQAERNTLIKHFNESSGTTFARAQEAIRQFSQLTERQIMEKVAASDDTDRIMQDLKNIADNWKPGSK
ncbi:MAG: hypothetical protein L6Q53_08540 [Candidatus Brocadia sinica]|nr:hypothetical protein [Candidatus Brocadia sinica]NUO03889.1 hypothetical protein [Candidatus Brocadia sinica]